MLYEAKWGNEGHSNQDINSVDVSSIPDHDLLVGGFPCQDYSVATTLKNSKGLIGKKGVLWWSIHKILSEKKKLVGNKLNLTENMTSIVKTYIDEINKGPNKVYGFIAQQIKEVIPEAVKIRKEIIPNIYKTCDCSLNKIYDVGNVVIGTNIEIIDARGRIVRNFAGQFAQNDIMIDCSGIGTGIYQIRLKGINGATYRCSIVIQ
jgi:hypothetical protein